MSPPATTSAAATHTLVARDPVTGEPLGSVPVSEPDAVARAVDAVAAVQPLWGLLRARDRTRYLRRAGQALVDSHDELVGALAREQGRPRAEVAALEVLPALAQLRRLVGGASAGLADHSARPRRAGWPGSPLSLTRVRLAAEPLGVVGVMGDGGAPFALPLAQVGAALLAGNGVVFTPAPRARLAAEAIAELLARGGLPEGLVRVVHGGAATGAALARAPLGALTVTGSRAAADDAVRARPSGYTTVVHSARTTMIVLADANLDRAARCAAGAACVDAGQALGALGRIHVLRDAYEPFLERLVARVRALRVGDPRQRGVHVGPLAQHDQVRALDELVSQALADGARLLCGGSPGRVPTGEPGVGEPGVGEPGEGAWRPAYYAPAVLAYATAARALVHEPVPGPLIAVAPVDSAEQALELASARAPGALTSVWSADRYRAARIARALHARAVWLNDHPAGGRALAMGQAQGGTREGGLRGGAEAGAASGRLAYARVAPVVAPRLGAGRLWWGPCDELHERAALALLRARSVRRADRERAWREGAPALARLWMRALLPG